MTPPFAADAARRAMSTLAAIAFIAAALIAAPSVVAAQQQQQQGTTPTMPPPIAQMCFVARSSRTSSFMVADHAVDTYRSRFPSFDWRLRAVGRDGNGIIKDAVQAFAVNGSDCRVLLGPGASSYAVALSPVVDVPWVDFSASSVELSDSAQHPFFSRMIPSDAYLGNGMANLMRGLGWGTINVVCSNEAYGRSITQRLSASFALAGGKIAVSTCLESNAGLASADELFRVLATSPTRVVAVGMSSGTEAFASFVNVTVERRLYERYVFVFSESVCSGDAQWRAIPGALCMTFRSNATRVADFRAHYGARDIEPGIAKLGAIGMAVNRATLTDTINVFDGFSHDAVLHAMSAMHSLASAPGAAAATAVLTQRTAIRDQIRVTSTDGMSGTVSLDAIGDRSDAQLLVLNINSAGVEHPVAYLENKTVHGDRTSTVGALQADFAPGLPTVFWFGLYTSDKPPVDIVKDSFELSLGLIAIACSAVLVAAILAFGICVARRNREALERLMAGTLFSMIAAGLLALAVLTVKILVAVALIIDDVQVGYKISYLSVSCIGMISTITDCIFRFRFIGMVLTSEEGVPFETEQYWMLRLKGTTVFTTVMSDLPTLIICSTMVATGSGRTRLELLVALCALAAFAVGMKVMSIPSFLQELARSAKDDEDEDDEIEADYEGMLTESVLLPKTTGDGGAEGDDSDDEKKKRQQQNQEDGMMMIDLEDAENTSSMAIPPDPPHGGGAIPSRPDGDAPLISVDVGGPTPNPLAVAPGHRGSRKNQHQHQQQQPHNEDVSWDAIFIANNTERGGGGHKDDDGTDGHSAKTSSGLHFKLTQAGRTVAMRLQEERIRKKQLLDFVLPEVMSCYGITPQQLVKSRFGMMITAHRPPTSQQQMVQASYRNLLDQSVRQQHQMRNRNPAPQQHAEGDLHH